MGSSKNVKESFKGAHRPDKVYREAGGGEEGLKAIWSVSGDPQDIAGVRAKAKQKEAAAQELANTQALGQYYAGNQPAWLSGGQQPSGQQPPAQQQFTPTPQMPTPYAALNQQLMRNASMQMPFAGNQQFPLPPQWGQQMPQLTGMPAQNPGVAPPKTLVANPFQTQPTTMGRPQIHPRQPGQQGGFQAAVMPRPFMIR